MRISHLKINGIENPIGFAFNKVLCSWKVSDTEAQMQVWARIEISLEKGFEDLAAVKEGSNLKSNETQIQVNLRPCTTYYWRVKVLGDNGESGISDTAFFETGKMDEPWKAMWIGPDINDKFHPVIRKHFCISNEEHALKKARLYICGLGVYEAYVNDQKVGEDYLAPFINDYRECFQYQTYDVTELLNTQKQEQILEIMLGKGWYLGTFGLDGEDRNFGDRMAAIAELRIEYADGKSEIVGTDLSWQYKGSDIEDSGIYFGEVLNRCFWRNKRNPWKQVDKVEVGGNLVERYSLPLKVKEERMPVEILHTPSGETVLDMGQNFAGYMEFMADFPTGTKIEIECGEVLQKNNFYHDNYRDATAKFIYISDGRTETVRPHFTYYGYRYLKVSGWPGELRKTDIIGKVVYSDLERTGFIESSNEKINRLYQNCLWSQKSNFLDMPTDCPQRSERLGWTGDAQVFAKTASYNMDTRAFFRKYLRDLRSEQKRCKGGVPNFIPNLEKTSIFSSVWGDAATFIPSQLYETFGNLAEMEEYYPLMKDWVDYMTKEDEKRGKTYMFQPIMQFGDWLALDGVSEQSMKGGTDDNYINAVYYYRSTVLLAQMATKLADAAKDDSEQKNAYIFDKGYSADAQKYGMLAENIRQAILNEYFTPSGRLSVDTQAAYIIALKFGIYRDKEKLKEQFCDRLRRDCYKIKCGFVGAPLLCTVLCENGMDNLAYHFLFQESFPSWLYCVNLGATTIWERWNSLLEDGTISGTGMNSLNHYSYGSVIEFFYSHIAGIRPLEAGYSRVLIEPKPYIKFHYFNCSYNSAFGKYVVNWKIEENGIFTLHCEIPFGCEAEIILPRKKERKSLMSGSYDFSYMPDRDYRNIYNEKTKLFEVADDKEVMEILKEAMPSVYRIIKENDIENGMLTFGELEGKFFLGLNPEVLKEVTGKIYGLKRW